MKTIDVINIVTWYQDEDTQKRLSTLPLKTQWIIRKNIKKFEPVYTNFTEFRDELLKKRNDEWFVEDNGKCEKFEQDGEEGLRIKEEFMEEFNKSDEELNAQITDIISEENEIEGIQAFDIDELIEAVDSDCELEINDLEILNLMGVE